MNDLKRKLLSIKRRMEKVSIPELDADVYIRRMNGIELEEFQAAQAKAIENEKQLGFAAYLPLQAMIVAMTVCDEAGERVFDDPDEVRALDGGAIQTLSIRSMEVNGLTKSSRDAIEKKV